METLVGILTNIFSSLAYDKAAFWTDKKKLDEFKDKLIEWANDYEKKNDGTVITSDAFFSYITANKIILTLFEYVMNPSKESRNEHDFLTGQMESLQKAVQKERCLTLSDNQLIKDFFTTIMKKIKNHITQSINPHDRAIFYYLMQENIDIRSILSVLNNIGSNVENIKAEIQEIHKILHEDQSFFLPDEWFAEQNSVQTKNLGNRYVPDLNIAVETSRIFDGIAENTVFIERFKAHSDTLIEKLNYVNSPKTSCFINKMKGIISGYLSENSQKLDISALTILAQKISEVFSAKLDEKCLGSNNSDRRLEYAIHTAIDAIDNYLAYLNSGEMQASVNPFILLEGEGGIGKSHVIADAVSTRLSEGQKSILLLGQHFRGEVPPLQEMIRILGIDAKPDVFLGYLNNIAMSRNERIVIFIDALNEGNGRNIWKYHLAGFLDVFKKHTQLGLVMSIRSEYTDYMFDNNKELEKEFVLVEHTGFNDVEYDAVKRYFDYFKVSYSAIPLASQEFRNPLFLRLLCEGYANKQIDINDIRYTDIYENYLAKINSRIAEALGYNKSYPVVDEVLKGIAQYRHENNNHSNSISVDDITQIVLPIQSKYQCKADLLEQLLSEGVLTKSIQHDGKDYFYTTYERFEDYLYSKLLADEIESGYSAGVIPIHGGNEAQDVCLINVQCDNTSEITNSPHERLNKTCANIAYNRGVLECLSIVLSQSTAIDIYDVFDPNSSTVKYAFVESLKWRTGNSCSEKAVDYLNNYALKDVSEIGHLFETLILIATKERHRLNGYSTVKFIVSNALPKRDAYFVPLFQELYTKSDSSTNRLLDWSVHASQTDLLSNEARKLAALMVSVFLLSTNLQLRDKATKSLSTILNGHIDILIDVLKYFREIDDPYIIERQYAAAFSCAVSELGDTKLLTLAQYVYSTIFAQDVIYPNILLRDYAKNIIDYAAYRLGTLPNVDLARVKPPYRSQFPRVPSDEEIKKYRFDHNDSKFEKLYWGQNNILDSMRGEYARDGSGNMYGDFGRYVFESYFRNWKQLNMNDLHNIAVKRIFELGYDVKLHGQFDANVNRGRFRDENYERIGKKYQWIALYELAAQVADNYPIQNPIDDEETKTDYHCEGSFEPHIRNIDPTISQGNNAQKKDDKQVHQRLYSFPAVEHFSWLNSFNDMPSFEDMYSIVFDSRKFILLNGWYSWQEEKSLGDKKYQNPTKDMWVNINCYIVKGEQIDGFIKTLSDEDFMGRWMPEPHENYSLYNKEYYWSDGFKCYQNEGDVWDDVDKYSSNYSKRLGKVLVPTFKYYSERTGDSWGEERPSWYKPCSELFESMDLRYGSEDTVLYDRDGRVVCFDSAEAINEKIGFFVDYDAFMRFICEKGYAVFWTLLAEKRILHERHIDDTRKFPMPHISQLHYYNSNGEIVK